MDETAASRNQQRMFQRFQCHYPARCYVPALDQRYDIVNCDFSGAGLGIIACRALEPGSPIELWIYPCHGKSVQVTGEVRWCKRESNYVWKAGIQCGASHLVSLGELFKGLHQASL